KTWGYAFDLNHGLLPYAPLLVIGGIAGTVLLLVRRSAAGIVMIGAVTAVAVGTEVQVNWNSGCFGIQRYVLWMIPGVAWLMVEGLGSGWVARIFGVLTIATSAVMADIAPFDGGYLVHTTVARWALIHHPQLYYPEPEVFVERVRNIESPWPR